MFNFLKQLLKPRAVHAKWLILLLLVTFFLLGFMGYLKPIEIFLSAERFSFQISSINISLYLIIKGSIAIIFMFWTVGILSEFIENRIKKLPKIRAGNKALITKIFQIFIYSLSFLILLDLLGINLTALTVFSGGIGIGLGFGLQKIASNFISGIILLFEKSIEDDDLIELDDGTFGSIKHTSARYTLIETFDGKEIMIPNEEFVTNRVINWTYSNTKGRIQVPIGVSYQSDIEKARQLIIEAAEEHSRCSKEPKPECYLREFGDSSVNFLLLFWVDDIIKGRYLPQSEVLFSIWKKFHDNNIDIPFPQRDLHIKNLDTLTGTTNGK